MKILTRKKALQLCYKFWLFIAKNNCDKYEAINYLETNIACYACVFDFQHKKYYCQETCIIPWPKNKKGFDGCCSSILSPFAKWRKFSHLNKSQAKKRYAYGVALLVREELLRRYGSINE